MGAPEVWLRRLRLPSELSAEEPRGSSRQSLGLFTQRAKSHRGHEQLGLCPLALCLWPTAAPSSRLLPCVQQADSEHVRVYRPELTVDSMSHT